MKFPPNLQRTPFSDKTNSIPLFTTGDFGVTEQLSLDITENPNFQKHFLKTHGKFIDLQKNKIKRLKLQRFRMRYGPFPGYPDKFYEENVQIISKKKFLKEKVTTRLDKDCHYLEVMIYPSRTNKTTPVQFQCRYLVNNINYCYNSDEFIISNENQFERKEEPKTVDTPMFQTPNQDKDIEFYFNFD